MYTPTPDYYRDYIQHGMQYGEEDTLAHYGVKGMKWRKHLKGKYYSAKSKIGEKKTKFFQKVIQKSPNNMYTDYSVSKHDYDLGRGYQTTKNVYAYNNRYPWRGIEPYLERTDGNIDKAKEMSRNKNYQNVEAGIAAGRERARKRKKK